MKWIVLISLVVGCSFDQSGLQFVDGGVQSDVDSSLDARNFDAPAPITDASTPDAMVDASPPPPDASLPDADEHPPCTTDIECENQFGPFHCCYVGIPPVTPGICVEGHFEGGLGCVPADGELPDAGP